MACRYIESCDYIPTLDELSQQVSLSAFHLQREFKKDLVDELKNEFKNADINKAIAELSTAIESALHRASRRFSHTAVVVGGNGGKAVFEISRRIVDHIAVVGPLQ